MQTATTAQTPIGLADTDDYATIDAPAQPVFRFSSERSQLVRFIDETVRRYTIVPDLTLLRFRAIEWLAGDEPGLDPAAAELKAKTLAAYGHAFAKTYQGFTQGAAAPF
ncbi:hypothetical protein [Paraburkholderia dilworthii]|uniref:Uncharacterized protein n=1 Tax=Paraburkholderia dilworthii TaxID=948106 RepID=A0ABW9D8R9_9BURK